MFIIHIYYIYNNYKNIYSKKKFYNKLSFHNKTNCFLTEPIIWFGVTFKTLNLTVFERGLHYPTTTISPSLTLKHGEQ